MQEAQLLRSLCARLGLATTKRVASDCNGTIEVVSSPNEGATFTVKLPT